MASILFVLGLALLLFPMMVWGFKTLPQEKWQIIASLPKMKREHGDWHGMNLTWYGILSANAYAFAVMIFMVLMGAVGAPVAGVLAVTAILLAICIPASTLVAKVIEKRSYTLTVGGASFVGIVAAPWVIAFVNGAIGSRMGFSVPMLEMMAAASTAYAFGEGLGRLACISFGCCFGKPLGQCHPLLRRIFAGRSFVYSGKTKKIAYAVGMEGVEMLPIQAVTSIIYVTGGLLGCWLFLNGFHATAYVGTLVLTQLWRVASEMFRADFRGGWKFSAYQCMALASLVYAGFTLGFIPAGQVQTADVLAGFQRLWDPAMIIFLQGIWITAFFHTGRSNVTDASISFSVIESRI